MILNNLGDVIAALGEPASAQDHYENALAIWRQRQDTWGIGIALLNLGNVALQEGAASSAGELFGEGLATCAAVGDQAAIADYFDAIGRLAAACHEWQPAAQLLSAATSLYHTVGIKQFPGHRAEHERALAAAQTALGDRAFAAARQEGECLTVDEAVDIALAISAEAHTCTIR
jgi:non-specific serine/threonine protein kinase